MWECICCYELAWRLHETFRFICENCIQYSSGCIQPNLPVVPIMGEWTCPKSRATKLVESWGPLGIWSRGFRQENQLGPGNWWQCEGPLCDYHEGQEWIRSVMYRGGGTKIAFTPKLGSFSFCHLCSNKKSNQKFYGVHWICILCT
jgi:hypothetical protein